MRPPTRWQLDADACDVFDDPRSDLDQTFPDARGTPAGFISVARHLSPDFSNKLINGITVWAFVVCCIALAALTGITIYERFELLLTRFTKRLLVSRGYLLSQSRRRRAGPNREFSASALLESDQCCRFR
jgi:hypothetical protein